MPCRERELFASIKFPGAVKIGRFVWLGTLFWLDAYGLVSVFAISF